MLNPDFDACIVLSFIVETNIALLTLIVMMMTHAGY